MFPSQLAKCLGCSEAKASTWLPFFELAAKKADLSTKERMAGFLAQTGHETGGLGRIEENLNYSWEGLLKIFPKYFKDEETAKLYARQPEKIANVVYASRMGNGDSLSGDGWRFRGRGLIQLTGRTNYITCGSWMAKHLQANPDYLLSPEGACLSAAWFWTTKNLNSYADKLDILGMTKVINGGTHGLDDRKLRWERSLGVLA